jgi:uncharacterized protein
MARKKAKQKQETTLVPHRTPNLSVLLERAKDGAAAQAVKTYLNAGGSADVSVSGRGAAALPIPLLHYVALYNPHPHRELAESIKLLIDAGADINIIGDAGADVDNKEGNAILTRQAPVVCAAERICCATVLKVLLEAGADPHMKSVPGCATALHWAAVAGSTESCEMLLARAVALLNARDDFDRTALMEASQHGHLHTAQLLLEQGADISVTDSDGQSALFAAAAGGHVAMMDMLVKRGLSITAVDSKGNTLLMIAADFGHTAATEWLIQHCVPVNAVDDSGYAALHAACDSNDGDNNIGVIELLLANGADVHKRTVDGKTALDVAVNKGHLEYVKALIAAGADVNHCTGNSMTSLHIAVRNGHCETVQLLLEHGAAAVINSRLSVRCIKRCCFGQSALIMCSDSAIAKLLLAAGADVHITTTTGDTCLHTAVRHECLVPMICLLIKAGADLHAVNNEGKTAAQIAHDKGYTLIEQLLNRAAQQQQR